MILVLFKLYLFNILNRNMFQKLKLTLNTLLIYIYISISGNSTRKASKRTEKCDNISPQNVYGGFSANLYDGSVGPIYGVTPSFQQIFISYQIRHVLYLLLW